MTLTRIVLRKQIPMITIATLQHTQQKLEYDFTQPLAFCFKEIVCKELSSEVCVILTKLLIVGDVARDRDVWSNWRRFGQRAIEH